MLVDLNNLKYSLKSEVQTTLNLKSEPEILGFRLCKGPWEKTYILDVETDTHNLSALILDVKDKGLELAGPFRAQKKEVKK